MTRHSTIRPTPARSRTVARATALRGRMIRWPAVLAIVWAGHAVLAPTCVDAAWHVPAAALKFRVELDPNRPQVPNVHLSQVRNADYKWSGRYYKIDGKLYKEGQAMTCPATTTFRCNEQARQFVALVGLDERVDATDAVVFEVYAGERKLYTSRPVTKFMAPLGILVRVPRETKRIKLQTRGADFKGRRRAYWVNAGFLLRDDEPRGAYVRLFAPGYDLSRYEVALFTLNGQRVPGEVLPTQKDGVLDVLFYGYYNHSLYYAYLVPKAEYEPPAREWTPEAGLTLETRYTDVDPQTCETLSAFRRTWQNAAPVGLGLVTSVHHGYPAHPEITGGNTAPNQGRLALYRYTGFFDVKDAGQYAFATASNWGSYLLVDDVLVVGWPGKHDYKAGRRGQKRGKIDLKPGVHKLEYLNYNRPGQMLTIAACRPPGEPFGPMTRSDFPSLQGYVVTGAEVNASEPNQVCFEWRVVDDWRLDRNKEALIRGAFRVLPPPASADYTYRWQFDDGVTLSGPHVDRVFLSAGERRVTVQMLTGQSVRAETAQQFSVGTLTEKIWVDPRDRQTFERAVSRLPLRRLPIREVVALYRAADGLDQPQWKDRAAGALLARLNEWIGRPEFHESAFALADYLRGPMKKQYDEALRVCAALQDQAGAGTRTRQHAMLGRAELLMRAFGNTQEALTLLRRAARERAPGKETAFRLAIAQAEALIATGSADEARRILLELQDDTGDADFRPRDVRHAGRVRHASQLAQDQNDPMQLDDAMTTLEEVLRGDPTTLTSPAWNLARLDAHLGRREYRIASHLAERLDKLDMTPYDRAQVLLRHVKAMCGTGDVAAAMDVYEKLAKLSPQSPEVFEAKSAITQSRAAPGAR